MSADIMKKEDIRSIKTGKALNAAMFSLLEKHTFRKITVSDICEESLISRATFYSRFTDKYDFLKWWIITIWPDNLINKNDIYEVMEQKINQYIAANKTTIKNLFLDADSWTLGVLVDVLHSILCPATDKIIDGAVNPKYVIVSNFYIGGMIQYILWQVKNDFPQDISTMNTYLHKVVKIFQGWNQ